jgi:hypothetical protein
MTNKDPGASWLGKHRQRHGNDVDEESALCELARNPNRFLCVLPMPSSVDVPPPPLPRHSTPKIPVESMNVSSLRVGNPPMATNPRESSPAGLRGAAGICVQKTLLNTKYSVPDNIMAAGNVRTHASAMLRRVTSWRPDPLAAMVPATPDESTWVVDTGNP